jgi:hypothetical protein
VAPGVELSDINWLAVLAGMAINIVLGFLWYSPKMPTGKIWMRGAGHRPDFKPDPKAMAVSMVLMVVGTFLLMFVLFHTFVAYRDAYALDEQGYDLSVMDGLMGGFFVWLGFFLPVNLGAVSWENKPWSYFFVNTLYYLVTLLIVGLVFALMMESA